MVQTVDDATVLLKQLAHNEASEASYLCGDNEYGYQCTRSKGHEGYHIALGSEEMYLVWIGHFGGVNINDAFHSSRV